MSPSNPVANAWLNRDAGVPARARLSRFVHGVRRARWRQILVEQISRGLFYGLLAALVAVLAVGVTGNRFPAWTAAGWVLGVALLVALLAAWRQRPDLLQVAVLADIRLNLKQRLSTAWELHQRDAPLAELLAAQAVRARLPIRSELVFPLQLSTHGKLVPVALTALLLGAAVAPRVVPAPARQAADEAVVSEGARLRMAGREMELRARRESLARSTHAAQEMQRLGERMHSAAVSREQALARLQEMTGKVDEQRRAALAEGLQTRIGPVQVNEVDSGRALSALRSLGPGGMLALLQDGRLGSGQAQRLGDLSGLLSRIGVPRTALDDALQRFDAGDGAALRELLQRLSRARQALEEARELGEAREQLRRSRENLGEAGQAPAPSEPPAAAAPGTGAGEAAMLPPANADELLDGGADGDPRHGAGAGSATPGQRRDPASRDGGPEIGPTLEARGQPGAGGVFVSEARVLPRMGPVTIGEVALEARFASQLEAVLAKEQYPVHHKDFVRRYFLGLSEGIAREAPAP